MDLSLLPSLHDIFLCGIKIIFTVVKCYNLNQQRYSSFKSPCKKLHLEVNSFPMVSMEVSVALPENWGGGRKKSTQLEPVNKYYKNKLLYLLSPQSLTKNLHSHLNTHYICWRFVSKPPRHKSPVYHIQTLHLTMQESVPPCKT